MGHIATSICIVCYFLVLLCLSAYGIHRYTMIYLYWKHRKSRPKPLDRFQELPKVTIQLPIFNELYVVRRLIGAVAKLDYPKELLQIQILDDSTDETTTFCREEEAKLREEIKTLEKQLRVKDKALLASSDAEDAATRYEEEIRILKARLAEKDRQSALHRQRGANIAADVQSRAISAPSFSSALSSPTSSSSATGVR